MHFQGNSNCFPDSILCMIETLCPCQLSARDSGVGEGAVFVPRVCPHFFSCFPCGHPLSNGELSSSHASNLSEFCCISLTSARGNMVLYSFCFFFFLMSFLYKFKRFSLVFLKMILWYYFFNN